MYSPRQEQSRWVRAMLAFLLFSMLASLSACGGGASVTRMQQQASQQRARLEQLIQHAQGIGIPPLSLKPIVTQEQNLNATNAPFLPFNDQPTSDYYRNLSTRYTQLQVQLQGLIATTTEQFQSQAQRDMQNFQTTLAQRRAHGLPVQSFTEQFRHYQALLATARDPKDYAVISSKAKIATESLNLMEATTDSLATFKQVIEQMRSVHLDVTAMQTQYESDQRTLANARSPREFQQLGPVIEAHYQQAAVNTMQALPFITTAKLNEFEKQVQLLKTYGMDASTYQKRLDRDRALMKTTTSLNAYILFSRQISADIASMHNDFVQGEARYLLQQFHNEAVSWGNAHLYYNKPDGKKYPLDAGYMMQGIGSDLDEQLSSASTPADFQAVVDETRNALFNLRMLEADYNDATPYNQVHASDLQMLNYYKLQQAQVLMISLNGQAMRLYQNGKLVRSFLVTTGRTELPALPGVWPVLGRESPTTFKSPEPPGSPYWYPDTPINYAILYHQGGYFVHDSWWRRDYGPGTQFPHTDSGGDTLFANNGSHGCINVPEEQAAWLYNNTDWNTVIAIY